jgi:serine/threonine protein kinase
MALSASQMALMSRLLDEALPLDEPGRRSWLEVLPVEFSDLADILHDALLPDDGRGALLPLTMVKIGTALGDVMSEGWQAGDRVGPYELLSPLGSGGMAEVWLAKRADGTFERQVALKLPLRLRSRRDLEPRFLRERNILASLNHPNIAKLFEAGFADFGQPYLALEYVAGTPITTYCDEHQLSVQQRLALFQQVLDAVQYAHARLVIHRDLKPSNILVTGAGNVQLLDFGIAKLLSEGEAHETELTRAMGRALTPDFAAPEQISGAPITTAADVYALGVMLYELLTGQRPYRLKRTSRGALEDAILESEPTTPSRLRYQEGAAGIRASTPRRLAGALKGDLDAILAKALKKSPADRYTTADAFREDIQRYLDGRPVLAQSDNLAYRALKFAKRHWVSIAVAGALLATLAAGLAATSYEARIAAEQRDIAVREAVSSEQVTRYLESLFDLASPERTGGKPIDVRTLVDHGQAQLDASLGNQPQVRERMLAAVGTLDCKIGRSAQCQKNLAEALAIRAALPHGDPRLLAQLQLQLASAYNLTARSEEAIALLNRAQPVLEAQRPQDVQQLAGVWYQMGVAQRWLQDSSGAQASLEKARRLLQDANGRDTLKSVDVLGQLAIIYVKERGAAALDLATKRLELVREGFGTSDLRYFDALNDYAEVANNLGEFAAAEQAWTQVVDRYADLVGRTSDKTIDAEMSLADVYFRENKLDRSIRWFRRAVEDYRLQGSTNKVEYSSALGGLAQVLLLRGDYKESEELAHAGYDASEKESGRSDAKVAVARIKWGHSLLLTGDVRRAIELLAPELPEAASQGFSGTRLMWLADCYRDSGQLALAEATYDKTLAYWQSIGRTKGLSLNMTYEGKAAALAAEKRYEEAAALYRQALDGYLDGGYVPEGPAVAVVKIELAQSLVALGRRGEARSLIGAASAVAERELAPGHRARLLLNQLRAELASTEAG